MSENNQNEVRKEPHVMSRDDVNDYDGLTLNEQGEQEERSAEDSFIHIYMIHIHELPWWKKLLGGLGIAVFYTAGIGIGVAVLYLWSYCFSHSCNNLFHKEISFKIIEKRVSGRHPFSFSYIQYR